MTSNEKIVACVIKENNKLTFEQLKVIKLHLTELDLVKLGSIRKRKYYRYSKSLPDNYSATCMLSHEIQSHAHDKVSGLNLLKSALKRRPVDMEAILDSRFEWCSPDHPNAIEHLFPDEKNYMEYLTHPNHISDIYYEGTGQTRPAPIPRYTAIGILQRVNYGQPDKWLTRPKLPNYTGVQRKISVIRDDPLTSKLVPYVVGMTDDQLLKLIDD
jgi:hypothetical protein